MDYPKWVKPHLRQRLEQEKADKERTGPKQGEPALVADEKGKIKTITTDHKPVTPKNGLVQYGAYGVNSFMTHDGVSATVRRDNRGRITAIVLANGNVHRFKYDPETGCLASMSRIVLRGNRWREQREREE